ncbi:MAG: hypothetical protein GY816_17385 [Cytophagales bacterium]|nr:hypothetical protein [Cytophagales bacterium]
MNPPNVMEMIRQQNDHQHNPPTQRHLTKLLLIYYLDANGLNHQLLESTENCQNLERFFRHWISGIHLPPNRRALAEEITVLTMDVEAEVR